MKEHKKEIILREPETIDDCFDIDSCDGCMYDKTHTKCFYHIEKTRINRKINNTQSKEERAFSCCGDYEDYEDYPQKRHIDLFGDDMEPDHKQ